MAEQRTPHVREKGKKTIKNICKNRREDAKKTTLSDPSSLRDLKSWPNLQGSGKKKNHKAVIVDQNEARGVRARSICRRQKKE